MLEWVAAFILLAAFLALLPAILRRVKPKSGAGGGSGLVLALGIAFSMVFDPKTTQTTEINERKDESGDSGEDIGRDGTTPSA